MKRSLLLVSLLFCSYHLSAKKVKFAVDMSAELLNTTGVHIYGNFQSAAGFPFDWDPGSTVMTQEISDTNVYSVILDIPAFQVYEYRFINGDQSYEVEFVPEESRINGAFDDNRWMYLDSLSDDTAFIGVIPYSANAPEGLSLVVFQVNMILQAVSSDSVHVSGSFQGWNPAAAMMITFNDTVYRYQAYIPNGTYQYKFVNGDSNDGYEYVGGACAVNGSRQVTITGDVILDPANFGSCLVGLQEHVLASNAALYPNPTRDKSVLEFHDNKPVHRVTVSDLSGRILQHQFSTSDNMRLENLTAGVYLVAVTSDDATWTQRLVVQ